MTYQRTKNGNTFTLWIAIAVVLTGSLGYQLNSYDSDTMVAVLGAPFRHAVASKAMFWVAVFTIHIGGLLAFLMEERRIKILCTSAFVLLSAYVAAFLAVTAP
ncbi:MULTISPECIES: hypothetical protein [Massilia]|jgi:hypothetical protein|uniref:hypothetical protein n=1 Tax=Massilia TaxID=149698 RepID=UPI001269F2BB|nr:MULTISPECIES: hypothetical protein [Massilia]